MAIKYLTAKVRYQPGAVTIDLDGELTHLADETLNRAYSEAESHNPTVVLLNFNGVNYFDSAGIALLINLLAQARQSDRSLIAYGLNAHILEIFKLSGLTKFMGILPNETNIPMCEVKEKTLIFRPVSDRPSVRNGEI
jgi:anti-anti-sigma factor